MDENKIIESSINRLIHKNLQMKVIKNLKFGAKVARMAAPYVIVGGIVGTIYYSALKQLTNYKIYLNTITQIDGNANKQSISQYASTHGVSQIYLYGRWQANEDDTYTRNCYIYTVNEQSVEEVLELFNQDNLNLDDIYGKPTSIATSTATSDELSDEDLQEESFMKAVVYTEDKDNYLVENTWDKKNILEKIFFVVAGLCIIFCSDGALLVIIGDAQSRSYSQYIEYLDAEYELRTLENKEKIAGLQRKLKK